MPEFEYNEFLWGLILVPLLVLLFLYALKKKQSTAKKIGDPWLVQQLTAGHNPKAFKVKFILIALALVSLIVALANPRVATGEQKVNRTGIDVMIALDVSKSMLAQDIKPTRLDRAKQVLSKLMDKLSNDRVGIVVFAGKAYLQMPLTSDHAAAKMYLSAASTESVPTQGTVISDALRMCAVSFNAKEKKYKAVVLISDGEDHDEKAIKTAGEMSETGVVIHTVGIGSPQGAPLLDENGTDYKKDNEGNTVISKLNEEELRSIAEKSNGQYLLFNNTDAVVSNIIAQLNSMDKRSVTDDSLVNYESYFQYFLLLALLLLAGESLVSEKRKRSARSIILKPVAALVLVFFTGTVIGQTQKEIIKMGNESYRKNEFGNASNAYTVAANKNPMDPIARFNLGNAQYRSDKKEEAIKAYEDAAAQFEQPVEKSNAFYNKGVILQNDKKIPECIEVYKTALRLDPNNEDARQNLQKALQQQKQQKQEKQKDQKDQKNKQKQEPKPQPSKLSREDAENKLKALQQQEKNLQDKLHKVNAAAVNKPEKDW